MANKIVPMKWQVGIFPSRVFNPKTKEYETIYKEARYISLEALKERAKELTDEKTII